MRSGVRRHLEHLRAAQSAGAVARPGRAPGVAAAGTAPEPDLPLEFSWRDYTILLLHVAAEIEHALMVQYLYAAYSLGGPQVPPDRRALVRNWQTVILGIAKEEMAHLITVENVLRFLGGSLSFDRDDYPFRSDFFPFPFTLEKLTRDSLAKYIYAEMPAVWTDPDADAIKARALRADQGDPLHRVGDLYDALLVLIGQPQYLSELDFHPESYPYQASWDEWGRGYVQGGRAQPEGDLHRGTPDLIIQPITSRDGALAGLQAIADQGEAPDTIPGDLETSHFRRFLDIYRAFPDDGVGWQPARPVPTNPCACDVETARAGASRPMSPITDPEARAWAHLANVRYRMLLVDLTHSFYVEPVEGTSTSVRGLLVAKTFGEMYNLRSIAGILMQLPQGPDSTNVAAPPFEMPYSLVLPHLESDRWRIHRDLIQASQRILDGLKRRNTKHVDYAIALADWDARARDTVEALIRSS